MAELTLTATKQTLALSASALLLTVTATKQALTLSANGGSLSLSASQSLALSANVTNLSLTASQSLTLGVNTGGGDGKASVSSNDTTRDFLIGKVVAGLGIAVSELNDGADEDLEVAASTAAASGLDANSTSTEGTASTLARSDHTHAIDTTGGTISTIEPGDAAAEGTGTGLSRRDHQHAIATAAPGQGIGGSNAEGTATSFARSDHDHTIRETGGPTNLTVGAVADGFLVSRSGTALVGIDPASVGVTDHGALTGLADDDHTQYLLIDGTRAMTGNLDAGTNNLTNFTNAQAPSGSAAAPGFTFAGDTTTGIFRGSSGVRFAVGGLSRWRITTAGNLVADAATFEMRTGDGNAGSPGLQFFTDPTTGLFLSGLSVLGVATGGVDQWHIDANGDWIDQVGGNLVDGVDVSAHAADSTIHFTEASIDHLNISNIGTNSHATIDTHLASTANPHSTSVANIGSGTIAQLRSAVTDATVAAGTGTDERIARWDAASGNLQSSNVTINDTGDILPAADKTQDIGSPALRFNNLKAQNVTGVAGNGTITLFGYGATFGYVTPNATIENTTTIDGFSLVGAWSFNNTGLATPLVQNKGLGNVVLGGAYGYYGTATTGTDNNLSSGNFVSGLSSAYNGTALLQAPGNIKGAFASGVCYNGFTGYTSKLQATASGAFAQGFANGSGTYGVAEIIASGSGSFAQGSLSKGGAAGAVKNVRILATAPGALAQGYSRCVGASAGTAEVNATGAGSTALGYSRGQINIAKVTASGRGSTAFGHARATGGNAYITASGHGSGAFGYALAQTISATGNNSFQFAPGTNTLADSLKVGSAGLRFKATTGAPGAPVNGDFWVANNYVYIRSNGVTCKVTNAVL